MEKQRVLICRLGAIGDTLITTPLVAALHASGIEVYYLTSDQGMKVLQYNPKIKKLIHHVKDSIPSSELENYFKAVAQAHECDAFIDLCESIEVNLALYPADPRYKYPKYERKELCDKNYYEETMAIARRQMITQGFPTPSNLSMEEWLKQPIAESLQPEFHASHEEDVAMRKFFAAYAGRFTVLIGLSGSARQKTWPYTCELIEALHKEFPDMRFITTGDESCQILEYNLTPLDHVMCTSGQWTIRESILACKYADVVISPDTGLLHGAGCFDTPKVALLTSTTHENISKHFKNVHPLEAKGVGCSPCFYLIYDADTQCNLGKNKACLCMDKGIPLSDVMERVVEIYQTSQPKRIIEVAHV